MTVNKRTLAIVWFCIFSINSLCSAVLISLIGTQWITMDGQGKFMVVAAVVMNWTNTLGAFLFTMLKKADPVEFSDLPQTVSSQTIQQTNTVTKVETNEKPITPPVN